LPERRQRGRKVYSLHAPEVECSAGWMAATGRYLPRLAAQGHVTASGKPYVATPFKQCWGKWRAVMLSIRT